MSETAVESRGLELAQHYLSTGQARRALEALEGASPDDLQTWRLRTRALHGLDRWRDTVEAARAGLELEPENTELLFYLAVAERLSGSLLKAKDAVKRGLRVSPHDPNLLLEQARIQTGYGLWGDAERSLDQAEAIVGPESIPVLMARARIAWGWRDYDDVERILGIVLALDPEDPDAHAMLGDLRAEGFDFTTASRHYDNAARLDPADEVIVENARELRVLRHPLLRMPLWLCDSIVLRVLGGLGVLLLWEEPLAGGAILASIAFLFGYVLLMPKLVRAWYERSSP